MLKLIVVFLIVTVLSIGFLHAQPGGPAIIPVDGFSDVLLVSGIYYLARKWRKKS